MRNKIFKTLCYALLFSVTANAQTKLQWTNVDAVYGPLPPTLHVYKTTDSLDGKPNIAFYVIADLNDKKLTFTADTTLKRRLTPTQFYHKNNQPLVVVNSTFFSFETNQNLNTVIRHGKLKAYNIHAAKGRGKDTLTFIHSFHSAIGISKGRKADVAWLYTDSSKRHAYAFQSPVNVIKDSVEKHSLKDVTYQTSIATHGSMYPQIKKWKMQTAVGGGPVLLQNGEINITNEEERKFTGKAINDRHPRTAMGYTKDGKLIILMVQGRTPGLAEGATLLHEAQLLKDLGCVEALNLDGGGSSCLLINGKETITPSDKGAQRAVPAVFIIENKRF